MTTTTSRTVWTAAPVERVAAFLSDFTTSAQWDPHTVSCTRTEGKGSGGLGVGARYRNVQKIAGRTSTLSYRVVEYEPGRRIVFEGGNDTVHTRDEMVFDRDSAGRTSVTYTVDVTVRGAAKVAQPLVPAVMKKIADDGAAGMRAPGRAVEPEYRHGTSRRVCRAIMTGAPDPGHDRTCAGPSGVIGLA